MAIINETLNQTVGETVGFTSSGMSYFQQAATYLGQLPTLISHGDYFAIMVALIGGFILLVLLNKLSGLLLYIIKRIIIFLITGIAGWYFFREFMARTVAQGFTASTIIFGVIGILVCLTGIVVAFITLVKQSAKHAKEKGTALFKEKEIPDAQIVHAAKGGKTPVQDAVDFKDKTLMEQFTDKSFLTIMVYLVVAEFGVFSSKTIAAPQIKTGMVFFALFLLASFIFIKASYQSYWKGLRHLMVTFVIGFILSILLGVYWGNYTYSHLFSMNYFTTESLVALITGVGVSLFAGSRK